MFLTRSHACGGSEISVSFRAVCQPTTSVMGGGQLAWRTAKMWGCSAA
jgi:hypothetical protein